MNNIIGIPIEILLLSWSNPMSSYKRGSIVYKYYVIITNIGFARRVIVKFGLFRKSYMLTEVDVSV
jgi:hypothetical protein